MNKLGAALAVVLVCAGPAVAAKPPKGGKPNANLSIKASATTVTFGKTITISGTAKGVAAGTTIDLQQNPYPYAGFKAAGKSAVVDPTGNFSIAGVLPLVHTQYKVVAKTSPPSESAATPVVRVRLRVSLSVSDRTPKRGASVRFYGVVAPAHNGKPVLIQKKTASGYKTVGRTIVVANGTTASKYSKKLRIRSSGTYRVVVQSADQDHDDGTSGSRTLKVH